MTNDGRGVGRVVLVGGGNMGGAMARAWLDGGVASAIHLVDPRPGAAMLPLIDAGRLTHSAAPPDDVFDVAVIAVKPQMMAEALPPLGAAIGPETVVVSVAAGTTVATIAGLVGRGRIVRAMPNTPALIGRGITGCYAPADVPEAARAVATSLLAACGPVVWVDDEASIDAVTAVSGSGPAYVFLLAEALAAAGQAAGLAAETAMLLARHTVAGAGELLIRSDEPPAELRRNVTSPNGTTQAALEVLMAENGLPPLMRHAVEAARNRAAELSRPSP